MKTRSEGKHIAVDGKTSRRSFDTEKERPAIHTVSAWLSNEGLVLGQRKTAAKSNEITANLTILRHFSLALLRRDPDRKLGIANSRKRAGWDRTYLLRILATERG